MWREGSCCRIRAVRPHRVLRHMRPDQVLAYAMRASSASPAVGYLSLHNEQQKELIDAAFAPVTDNLVLPVQGTSRTSRKPRRRADPK